MRMTRAFRILMAAVAVLVVLVIVTGPALAQPTYPPTTPPTSPANVAPTAIVPGAGVAPNVERPGVQGEVQGEGVGALAFTGAELTLLVAAFGILLAGGAVALIAARRRSRPQTG
jgi:hypothetical protein